MAFRGLLGRLYRLLSRRRRWFDLRGSDPGRFGCAGSSALNARSECPDWSAGRTCRQRAYELAVEKRPALTVLTEVLDADGRRVELTQERWEHILERDS